MNGVQAAREEDRVFAFILEEDAVDFVSDDLARHDGVVARQEKVAIQRSRKYLEHQIASGFHALVF